MSAVVHRKSACEGKHRFATFSLAEQTAHMQSQRHKGQFSAYACKHCGGFHVGTQFAGGVPRRYRVRRHPFTVYARDPHGVEHLIGYTQTADGGYPAKSLADGWKLTRITSTEPHT